MASQGISNRSVQQILADLVRAGDPAAQIPLKRELRQFPDQIDKLTFSALRANPFLELSSEEIGNHELRRRARYAEEDLVILRQVAAGMAGRRVAVFAMPKSGSSFIQGVIGRAAGLPFLSLTSVTADGGAIASGFGINGREQELDELAVILQTFRGRGRWIAQHHTRFTPYLGFQLRFHRIRPILTVRNIYDAIVSMDDMMMSSDWARTWELHTPHAMPVDYATLPSAERLTVLAEDFGRWLVKFLVSWKRAIAAGMADPLILSYERDILDKQLLGRRVGDFLDLAPNERAALDRELDAAPGEDARFNQGIAGRGALVPQVARDMLETYARRFRADLGNDGMRYLFGDGVAED